MHSRLPAAAHSVDELTAAILALSADGRARLVALISAAGAPIRGGVRPGEEVPQSGNNLDGSSAPTRRTIPSAGASLVSLLKSLWYAAGRPIPCLRGARQGARGLAVEARARLGASTGLMPVGMDSSGPQG